MTDKISRILVLNHFIVCKEDFFFPFVDCHGFFSHILTLLSSLPGLLDFFQLLFCDLKEEDKTDNSDGVLHCE